ncbi:MAG: LysR substrate-binding domain-containing protein [Rikenellaceae bacterium]
MTIVQLEYLVAVVNCGSFSLASEQCFVTQPSLSMQIKNLEQELGVVLLDRSKKPVIPTEVGAMVVANAREALKSYNYVKESVSEFNGEVSGTLRFGVLPTIAPYLMPKFIPEFTRKYPKVHLVVHELKPKDIIAALNKDELDVALMAGGALPKSITEQELFNDRFFAYISPMNNLHDRKNIRFEDISIKDLLLLGDGHTYTDQILELCGISRKGYNAYSFSGGSLETLMRIVDTTSKVTVIPEMAVPYIADNRRKYVKMLAKGAASRKISLAVRRTYVKASLIMALKETILAVAPKLHVRLK